MNNYPPKINLTFEKALRELTKEDIIKLEDNSDIDVLL